MKKVLAVALSGVMALSMLTACDGGAETHELADKLAAKGYNLNYDSSAKVAITGMVDYLDEVVAIQADRKEAVEKVKGYDTTTGKMSADAAEEDMQEYYGALVKEYTGEAQLLTHIANTNQIRIKEDTYKSKVKAYNNAVADYGVDSDEADDAHEAMMAAFDALPIYGVTDFGTDKDAFKDMKAEAVAEKVAATMKVEAGISGKAVTNGCISYGGEKGTVKTGVDYTFGYVETTIKKDGDTHYVIAWVVYEE